jgi:hypothetical protein
MLNTLSDLRSSARQLALECIWRARSLTIHPVGFANAPFFFDSFITHHVTEFLVDMLVEPLIDDGLPRSPLQQTKKAQACDPGHSQYLKMECYQRTNNSLFV